MHSKQNICPHVVAVIDFIGPKQIAHSKLTFPSPFSLSGDVAEEEDAEEEEEDVVVVVVEVRRVEGLTSRI